MRSALPVVVRLGLWLLAPVGAVIDRVLGAHGIAAHTE